MMSTEIEASHLKHICKVVQKCKKIQKIKLDYDLSTEDKQIFKDVSNALKFRTNGIPLLLCFNLSVRMTQIEEESNSRIKFEIYRGSVFHSDLTVQKPDFITQNEKIFNRKIDKFLKETPKRTQNCSLS